MTIAELAPLADAAVFDWPIFGLQDDVRPALTRAVAQQRPIVLATLFDVVGGAPRGIGAQMAFVDGAITGFLSGGCIEADIALQASSVLADWRPNRLVYGDGGPVDVRLPCGSRIEVLLEPVAPDDEALKHLLSLTQKRRAALWLTDGRRRVCVPAGSADVDAQNPFGEIAALAAVRQTSCGRLASPFSIFRAYTPPVRLIAMGSDPIALAVVKLAAEMGLQTILLRPKGPSHCPIPGITYRREEIETALAQLRPDPWTAIALLTHDPEQEKGALSAALRTGAGYVGVLGSRRRIPERIDQLKSSGFADEDIERLKAPIGLPISGKSPWEIAVSVIAEVIDEMAVNPRRHKQA